MPRNLPQYTTCASPGSAASRAGIPVEMLAYFAFAWGAGSVAALIIAAILHATVLGCVLGAVFIASLAAAVTVFIDWYQKRRLLCIHNDYCAVGTVLNIKPDEDDGDLTFNIALAPYVPQVPGPATDPAGLQGTWIQKVIKAMQSARDLPTSGSYDTEEHLTAYLDGIDRTHLMRLYQSVVRDHLVNAAENPNLDFQRHFFIKDPAQITDPATWAAIPDDDPATAGDAANPMFRCPSDDPDDPHIDHPYVFFHCEVEGNFLVAQLENFRVAIIAGAAAFLTFCALCEAGTVGAGTILCPFLVGLLTILFALFAWLFSHLFNNPDDQRGVHSVPDPTATEDPAVAAAQHAQVGDVIAVFGNWIMDMEHNKYFEIHPVKAWYKLCPGTHTEFLPPPPLGPHGETCDFDVSALTPAQFADISQLIRQAETLDPDGTKIITVGDGLSSAGSALGGIR